MNTDTFFFPWVRKGLANNIAEEEVFGKVEGNDSLARMRAVLSIHTKYQAFYGKDDKVGKEKIDDKDIRLYGPGDVSSVQASAISLRHPTPGSSDFPADYFPYVEFPEPDFPWRYTPAKPNAEGRLRPWLALLTFRKDQITVQKPDNNLPYLSFTGDDKAYRSVFYDIRELSRAAHAQGPNEKAPILSRIIGLRGWKEGREHQEMVTLEPFTEYVACLVPTFETGRLRGLGYDPEALAGIVAQTPSWVDYAGQKDKPRGLEFPIYASWEFTSGDSSFETLVKELSLAQAGKAGVCVDVTHMGEGFDYEKVPHETSRKKIIMPAATRAPQGKDEDAFPAVSGNTESVLYDHLLELVTDSPVFMENASDIGETIKGKAAVADDPIVVPPVYGARHVMATSLEKEFDEGNTWLSKLNLDVHYRAVAGLGRKVILENQEDLMDRAWRQVEAIQALNQQLYRRLLSIGANTSLQGKVLGQYGANNKYLASLMYYLGSMADAKSKNGDGQDVSISSVLADMDVPAAFATPSFHRMADQVAKVVAGLDTKSVLENILEHQTFRFPEPACDCAYSLAALREYADKAFSAVAERVLDLYLRPYFHCSEPFPSSYCYYISTFTVPTSDSYDFHNWSGYPIPHSPIAWYMAFFRYAYNRNLAPWGDLYSVLKLFFDGEYDRHPCYGQSRASAKDNYVSNLIGYPSKLYVQLFGSEKPITAFKYKSSGTFYVVNIDVMQQIAAQYGVGSNVGPSRPFFILSHMPYLQSQTQTAAYFPRTVPGYRPSKSTTGDYYPEEGLLYCGVRHAPEWVRNHASPIETTEEERSRLWEQAEAYLKRPSYIYVDVYKLKDMTQTFRSEQAYRRHLMSRRDGSELPLVRIWNEFNDKLSELERKFGSRDAGPKKEDKKVLPPTMTNDLPYQSAISTVSRYYDEFFADTPTGERLRNGYIDELLLSKYPILAYPIFPEPVSTYLQRTSEDLVLPGCGELPDDSVTVFESNPAFVEAYLAGMNTEMGRELLWREYPTDQRGSYFRKFWDSESSVKSIREDSFFDIGPMHDWKGKLGENAAAGKANLLIFAIKGRLMRLYPTTRIYLRRAVSPSSKKLKFDPKATEENGGILSPVMETFLGDLLVLGFKTSFKEALGNPAEGNYGYFLTFQEDVEGLDFTCEKPEDFAEDLNPAQFANRLKNDPSIMGKHVSLFLK